MDFATSEASSIIFQILKDEGKDKKVDLRILHDMLQDKLKDISVSLPAPRGDARFLINIIKDFLADRGLFSTLQILSKESGVKDHFFRNEILEEIGIVNSNKTVLETLVDLSLFTEAGVEKKYKNPNRK